MRVQLFINICVLHFQEGNPYANVKKNILKVLIANVCPDTLANILCTLGYETMCPFRDFSEEDIKDLINELRIQGITYAKRKQIRRYLLSLTPIFKVNNHILQRFSQNG